VDPAGFLKVSALGIEEQRVRVTICDGGVRDARRLLEEIDRPALRPCRQPLTSLPNDASAALAGDRIAILLRRMSLFLADIVL
jgi:hypothetical protein